MKAWIILILLTTPVLAADFPDGSKSEVLESFSGGLDTVHEPHDVANESSPNMRNVFVHRLPKNLTTRPGFVVAGTTLTLQKVTLGFTFNHEDGSKEYLVSDDSVVLTTKDYNTYVLVSSGLNTAVHLEAAQIRNKVWFTNGSDAVFTWDGTTKQKLDGTLGTPNVPKFKYITGYQERVFGLNTANNTGSLDWSDVASTAGAAIAPDNFLAWPVTNRLFIGQGDGQQGTALWLYRSQLQIGKERSIYTLYGTNTATYYARKTEGQAGVSSQDSVVNLDGVTYYKGYDGIYAYNGISSQRISDLIKPDADNMQDATTQVLQNAWETAIDFNRGQYYGTTTTVDGFLIVDPQIQYANHISSPQSSNPIGSIFIRLDGTTGQGPMDFGVVIPTETVDQGQVYFPQSFTTYVNWNGVPGGHLIDVIFQNLRTGTTMQLRRNVFTNAGEFRDITWSRDNPDNPLINPPTIYFTPSDLTTGKLMVQITTGSADWSAGGSFTTYQSSFTGNNTIVLIPGSTGQFISDVATLAVINAWGNFDSIFNTNGGGVNFFYRTSTSVINITTQTWVPTVPGTIITAPLINNFFQWATTMTAISTTMATNVDRVSVDHIAGQGSSNRPLAIDWKNEYWLSVSTDLTSNLRLQYVKAWATSENPLAWNVLSGINIASIWKDGSNTLYGGSSSTGTIFRLDYGTNDNGLPIDAFWDTPQMSLGDNWFQKQLSEEWIDAQNEPSSLRLSLSVDGKPFVEELVDLTGNTRVLKVLYNHNEVGKYFQWRFRNNSLDQNIGLNNFGAVYRTLKTR